MTRWQVEVPQLAIRQAKSFPDQQDDSAFMGTGSRYEPVA
jgi:hypothetical protein